jgi:hypothetical protein
MLIKIPARRLKSRWYQTTFRPLLSAVAAVIADLTTMIAARYALPAVAVPGVGAVIALAAGSCCLVLCVGGGIHYLAFR